MIENFLKFQKRSQLPESRKICILQTTVCYNNVGPARSHHPIIKHLPARDCTGFLFKKKHL